MVSRIAILRCAAGIHAITETFAFPQPFAFRRISSYKSTELSPYFVCFPQNNSSDGNCLVNKEDGEVNRPNVGYVVLVACLLSLLSPRLCSAASASGPFASTCLSGRYVSTGSGLDITFLNPFAVVGALNFTCGKNGTGAYSGSIIVTYPIQNNGASVAGSLTGINAFNNVLLPLICSVQGTYTIDPTTGLIASVGMIGNPANVPNGLNSCLDLFQDTNLQEFGYLSDPTAQKIYELETGQGGNDVLSLVYTKAGTQNSQ